MFNRRRGRNHCVPARSKAPIVAVTFGGALLCFSFVSATFLVVTVGISLVVLGIWLLKNC
ncbi:MAG: hypothetical protein FWG83_06085 [Oscillospiraceae bacterium]|nr:hypothetical protein [Oscillospiraceae bacterium]